ncbi:MAG: deoxyguanosinetriphosphate triphosphohydrolase [Leptospiraceae bacterium]|nr:deoxyguanosinetriphosphate triphosphohydrolase [Leptospiraceae bacterium]
MHALAAQGEFFTARRYAEPEHPLRNPFQRDRDRVVHSRAFRRLEYKTQVFVNHLGDNYRTRLTHSIEVAQLARTVARALGLNEDLTETVALAHDLGHPPFGHAGEKALHEKMRSFGGFDHNLQTLRVVTLLEERYPDFPGLNLTRGTLACLEKHTQVPNIFLEENRRYGHCLEARIVDLADEIAYNNHDIDDGLESGYLSLSELANVPIWQKHYTAICDKYPTAREKLRVRFTIRSLIDSMVTDLIHQTEKNLQASGIKTFDELLQYTATAGKRELVSFSAEMSSAMAPLKKFLQQHLYQHPEIAAMNKKAKEVIGAIFDCLMAQPALLPPDYAERTAESGKERVIADFIAGMTDRYALSWFHKNCG